MKSHSLAPSGQKDVVIEPKAGGRWYEIGNDGSEQPWHMPERCPACGTPLERAEGEAGAPAGEGGE